MNTTFQSNQLCLNEYNQHIFAMIEEQQLEPVETLHVGEDMIFKLVDEQGREFYSASVYDPVHEADVYLEGVNFDNTGYIIFGLSSTALIRTVLERKTDNSWVFIIEPDLRLIKAFLSEFDFSRYQSADLQRIVFFGGEEAQLKEYLSAFCNSLVGYYFMQTEVLRTFPAIRRNKDLFDRAYEVVAGFIKLNVTNIGNSLDDTLMGITNELKNLKYIMNQEKRFKHLENAYKDKPIICVASGPSLDKQIPLLREAKGKAVIICAESTLRVLLNNGIEPDFVSILERGTPSYEISLAGLEIPQETALVGLSLIDHRIYEKWHRYQFTSFKSNIAHSRFLNELFHGDFGEMYSGNSSAHMNFSLAKYLGGNPIVFIGQDLAYSETGQTHSKDSVYVNGTKGLDQQQIESIQKPLKTEKEDENNAVYLDGYYGGKVKSRDLWAIFKQWMDNLVHLLGEGIQVINSTEGGARIEGCEQIPFKDVVETYCQNPIPSISTVYDQLPIPDHEPKVYLQLLCNRVDEIKRIYKEIREMTDVNRKNLKELYDDIENGKLDLVEARAARVLRNTEKLIHHFLAEPYAAFFYRPLIANLHVKSNPISRISSMERLQTILRYQDFFMHRVIFFAHQLEETYEQGFQQVAKDFGYSVDDFEREVLEDGEHETTGE
ncbi:motility associated factor glycosyltransferase family protein [Tumebacillus sp. ITR2]|uniref:Motility associated factor glycosyltransferase family protein n=1 Tax=Tumebacillus amylolyticus TaxID=2801339 RepID=A0ABS1J5G0_9BACL|nr:6-hydroxymethylpterin diphosphokinase MptE-like protein [Tumebacillus amylolyticus]MBL0385521.1 motility associated factor glycosyltransferase family protein [Tumebacillus amylolyticus]